MCVSCMVHARQIPWEHEYEYYSVPVSVFVCTCPRLSASIYCCHACPTRVPVTGFLRAGTVALWRWSNPPGRTAGTQRYASHQAPASSTAPSVHGARWGSPGHKASGSPAPPAPALRGCSFLKRDIGGEGECWRVRGRQKGHLKMDFKENEDLTTFSTVIYKWRINIWNSLHSRCEWSQSETGLYIRGFFLYILENCIIPNISGLL